MRAMVAEEGQVTIPKELRDRLGIRASTVLEFREQEGHLVVEIVTDDDPVSRVMGCLKSDKSTDEIMRELRRID